jgi:hypothetical protein
MDRERFLRSVESMVYGGGFEIGMNDLQRCEMGLTKLFIPDFDSKGIAGFRSLREAYTLITGDSEIDGIFRPDRAAPGLRACASYDSSTFATLMQNVLNMMLVKEYRSFPYHEDRLISERFRVNDFRTVKLVSLGYLPELPEVDPEAANYYALAPVEEGESSFSLGQKGGILWFTRRTILNDSVGLVRALVTRAARAARLGHAKYAWGFYLRNATAPDGTRWFTSGHGNLGSGALTIANAVTAVTALGNMVEAGSGEKLGISFSDFQWALVAGVSLWNTAVSVNKSESYFTGNDLTTKVPNPLCGLFGAGNERVIICPFESDGNDWGILRSPSEVPILGMGYYASRIEPEFILQEGPTEEHVFIRDQIGYKILHEYGGALSDYRGAYKCIV